MCGRFEGTNETWAQLQELLSGFAQLPPETAARYAEREMRPTNNYSIITRAVDGGFEVIEARWWLVPAMHRGTLKEWTYTTFNAKIEEVTTKASFRGPWKSKDCLVPVRSFWEWKTLNPEAPKSKQVKERYCITRGDNHPMVLAGLWEKAKLSDGEVTSFTIMTRGNGPDMEGLHKREPVLLNPDQWKPWLDCVDMPELLAPTHAGLFRPALEGRTAYA